MTLFLGREVKKRWWLGPFHPAMNLTLQALLSVPVLQALLSVPKQLQLPTDVCLRYCLSTLPLSLWSYVSLSCSHADKLAARMELEFKRLQRRKLFSSEEGSVSNPGSPVSSSGSGMGQGASSKDQPIFTLKQVQYTLWIWWHCTHNQQQATPTPCWLYSSSCIHYCLFDFTWALEKLL